MKKIVLVIALLGSGILCNAGSPQLIGLDWRNELQSTQKPTVVNAQPNPDGKPGPNGTICTLGIPGIPGNYSYNYPAPCTPRNTFVRALK